MKHVAIVDYGMGNLFSVKHAAVAAGMRAEVTTDADVVTNADAVILPGVGAYRDAMDTLREQGMVDVLKKAANEKSFMGICLGMQLLMTESLEFGRHEGLGVIPGSVVKFNEPKNESGRTLKIPQVGWNTALKPMNGMNSWEGTPLEGIGDSPFMYFVHSFHVAPDSPESVLAVTRYGEVEFPSALCYNDSLFAFQFHPERSGPKGIAIYKTFSNFI